MLSHGELRAEVDRLVGQLRSLGLGIRDRIAIVMPNGPEMALAFLAAACTGCAAPLNPKYRPEELRFYIEDLGAKALITRPDESGDAARTAAGEAHAGVLSVTLTGHAADGPGSTDLTASSPEPTPLPGSGEPAAEDVALVLHTSGTTSRPKIVPLQQRHLARSAAGIAASLVLTAADRSLQVMPLFHIHGLLAGLLAPLSAGGSVACTEGFDAFKFFAQLEELRPTYYTAVPTMHQMAIARSARHREAARDAGLRFVRSSSASLPEPVLQELGELFGSPVIEAYGMDRGHPPDVRQSAAPRGSQAPVGGHPHRHRDGRARRQQPPAGGWGARRGVDQGSDRDRRLREQPRRQ